MIKLQYLSKYFLSLASEELDFDHIYGTLYQGSYPKNIDLVKENGFDVLVLCAKELQNIESNNIEIIHAPLNDSVLTDNQLLITINAAEKIAKSINNGKMVLTTCAAGLNRSGLVNALTIYLLSGKSGNQIIKLIQNSRSGALFNPYFLEYLEKLK